MPFDYRIDQDNQVVLGRIWGVWTTQDVIGFRERARSDPDFPVGMRQLIDLSEVTDVELTVSDVLEFGKDAPFVSGARRAYVAPEPATFGMLRAYQATADEADSYSRVFRSMDEARAWLGLD